MCQRQACTLYIKPLPYTTLTNSRSSPSYMTKTNLDNDIKSLTKSLCDTQSNSTNDIINKNNNKKLN